MARCQLATKESEINGAGTQDKMVARSGESGIPHGLFSLAVVISSVVAGTVLIGTNSLAVLSVVKISTRRFCRMLAAS